MAAARLKETTTNVDTKRERDLIKRWITPDPHKPGPAEARVLPRYVSMWALIRQLELENGDAASVAECYELPAEAVEAAIAYYGRHQASIDERIARNRAYFASL